MRLVGLECDGIAVADDVEWRVGYSGNKLRLWAICGCADVVTGKRRIKSADAKCGSVGKRRMCK